MAVTVQLLGDPPEDTAAERWLELPRTGGAYFVSSLGRVYSLPRMIETWECRPKRIRGGYLKQNGSEFTVSIPFDNCTKTMSRMALILLAFERPPKDDEVATLIDTAGPVALGNVLYKRSYNAILDEEKVKEIVRLNPKGKDARKKVADRFGISVITLSHVMNNRSWIDVPRETKEIVCTAKCPDRDFCVELGECYAPE